MKTKLILSLALLAINQCNLNAQDFTLHIYEWHPVSLPLTNILISWDGPCGTYTVLTNSDIGDTNGWGTYATVVKHDWLNPEQMTVYTIGDKELFFNVALSPDANQTNCPETQIVIITDPVDQTTYTNWPAQFNAYTVGPEDRTYQWYFEESAITNATNQIYRIENTLPSDKGDYFMVVTSSSQNLTSDVAYLTVLEEEPEMEIPEPSPPLGGGMGEESMALDLILWSYDPLSIINPIIQSWKNK